MIYSFRSGQVYSDYPIIALFMENLKVRHTTFSVDFHFANNITLLMGDSGVGKTLVFSVLQKLAVTDQRLLCLNYLDANKGIGSEIAEVCGKLIIIDNADAILTDEMRKKIAVGIEDFEKIRTENFFQTGRCSGFLSSRFTVGL